MNFFPLPSTCALGTVFVGEGASQQEMVVITTSFYNREQLMSHEALQTITAARIDFAACDDREGYHTITLTASHDCGAEDCPILVGRVAFDLPSGPATEFQTTLEKVPSFSWSCNGPDYEANLFVSGSSLRVTSCKITPRELH